MREIIFTLLALHVYNVSGTCTYYTIRPGDTCYSLGIIEAFNPHINCHMLRPGEHVCIQVHSACGPNSYMHKIQYGDTCFSLGIRQELYPTLNCNNLKTGDHVCVIRTKRNFKVNGDRIELPICSRNRYYRIMKDDTCYLIGQRFGYTYTDLIALNYWDINCNNLQIGEVICV